MNVPKGAMNSFDSSDDGDVYDESPFLIDWIDLSKYGYSNELAISALPGCRFKDTWRRAASDIDTIKAAGIKDVIVFCTKGELHLYRVPKLLELYSDAELTVKHVPIPDGHVPSIEDTSKILDYIRENLHSKRRTLIHCYAGLGRAGLVACSLFLTMDPEMTPDRSIEILRTLRGPRAIQTVKQYNFIHDLRDNISKMKSSSDDSSERSVSR